MKKRPFYLIRTWLTLLLPAILTACALGTLIIKINTAYNPEAQFNQYRTYNWYPAVNSNPMSANLAVYKKLEAQLKKAVAQEIEKKGLRPAAEDPQVLLAFDVSLPRSTARARQTYPEGFGYGLAWHLGLRYDYEHSHISNYLPVDAFAAGTILIDVIDASNKELLWRGWAEEVITDFDADDKTVTNYVDDILDKYPPKVAAQL